MTILAKNRIRIVLSVIAALLLSSVLCAFFTPSAKAEEGGTTTVELVPVEAENSEIVYRCFDEPLHIYADSIGLLVAGHNSVEALSGETEVTAVRDISAQKIYRHIEHGEHAEYLIALYDGVITSYREGEQPTELELDVYVLDFAVDSDILYALTENSVVTVLLGQSGPNGASTVNTPLVSPSYPTVHATAIAVANGTVYAAVNSAFGRKQDICSVAQSGTLTTVLIQSDEIYALAAANNDQNGYLYALTRNEIIGYSALQSGGLVRACSTSGTQSVALCVYGEYVYTLDSLNALHKLSADLTEDNVLFASSSNVKGFFNMPSGATVKNSTLYIADTVNNRIALYSDDITYVDRTFTNPVSVACDSAGTVYVAYEYGKIGIFANGDFSRANETTLTDERIGIIRQIAVDANKSLYILSSGGLWKRVGNELTLLDRTVYKAITLSVGRDKLYALSTDSVELFTSDGESSVCCAASADALSIAVDLDETVYTLSADRITRRAKGTAVSVPLSLNGEAYTLGSTGMLLLCTVENGFATYGDVIIVDTYRHRVLKSDGKAALGVRLVDENYEVPDIADDNTPAIHDRIIRTALRDVDVFSLPMETKPEYTITAGRNVIVPMYALEETPEYSLVLIDDLDSGKLIQGYVYKDALSEPLPYDAPPSEVATVFNAATPVYKYPSRNAKTVLGFGAVNSNTEYKMLDFVPSYRDDYGYLWYRIELDVRGARYEGYILAINISTMSYEPVFIRPSYDAHIISYEGSAYAPGYSLEDGVYTQIAELPTGTEVEIIGAFDTSTKYTQVKYLDPERGTLTCYVETVYIEYDGVNIVLLVAVIVIVVTVILAGIIIAKTVRNKKKRLVGDNDERQP